MFPQLPSVPTQLCGEAGRACGLGGYGCLGFTVSEVIRQLE